MVRSETFSLALLAPSFGMEVRGLDMIALHSDPEVVRALRRAFAASKGLLLFRNLEGWRREDMVALSAVFGTVEASPPDGAFDALLEDDERVHVFSKVPSARVFDTALQGVDATARDPDQYDPATGRPSWHTDQSFRTPPPRASAMYCVSTPSDGSGDTLFASTIDAFEALPPPLASAALAHRAVHSYAQLHTSFKRYTRAVGESGEHSGAVPQPPAPLPSPTPEPAASTMPSSAPLLSAERENELRPALHPLAPVHRASNRRCLYLAPHAIASLEAADAADNAPSTAPEAEVDPSRHRALINTLTVHATAARFRYRHRWRAHDLLVWDNGCTLHAATQVSDARAFERTMWRTTMLDDAQPEEPEAAAELADVVFSRAQADCTTA